MLAKIGVSSVDELFRDVPAGARTPRFDLPTHAGEMEVERALAQLAAQNTAAANGPFFFGEAADAHPVPPAVHPVFLKADIPPPHTPHPPELAQMTPQGLFA